MKNLTNEMRKTEIEMQKETYVSSSSVQVRINTMYQIIKESMKYVKEVVTFMNFDIDQVQGQSLEIQFQQPALIDLDPTKPEQTSRNDQKTHNLSVASQFKDSNAKVSIVTLDQCFYKHIYELAEVILSVLCEIYKESRTQTSIELVQLFDMLQSKTDKNIVQEIYSKFFSQNRIHFAQFLSLMNEKQVDIEQERNGLKLQVQKLNKQMQEIIEDQLEQQNKEDDKKMKDENIYQEFVLEEDYKDLDVLQEPHQRKSFEQIRSTHQKIQQEMMQLQKHSTLGQQQFQLDSQGSQNELNEQNKMKIPQAQQFRDLIGFSGSRQSSAAVATALQKSQEKRIIELQQQENLALKERVKEVRLNMQRQISELQEQLKISKDQHQGEMNKLKIQYGKDLSLLHQTYKNREIELRQELQQQNLKNAEELCKVHCEKIEELNKLIQAKEEDLTIKLDRSEFQKSEVEREMRKLKKQSNLVSQGGWGTFAIVFEDNPKKTHHYSHAQTSIQTPTSPGKLLDTSVPTLVSKKSVHNSLGDQSLTDGQSSHRSNDEGGKEDMSLEKINHFIEVGFLMDQKSFKHLDTYKEKTFDTTISKFLFEFQDPVDNFKMIQLQNKIRQQLSENFALFNEINPVYVTLNLGRNISPFWDESISQDHFKLIKREGFHLGETYLMVNFLKCDEPPNPLVIRVIAFESENCCQHNFDMTFEDLMLLVDGNMKLLEEDHHSELCQMILNNLTQIKKKPQQNQQQIPQFNLEEDDHSQAETSISKIFNKRQKSKLGDCSLAVEHKLFFNDHHRNEFERNKLIIAKHDRRKKGLIQEKSVGTDFEKSIIYEAFDLIYKEQLTLQRQEVNVELFKGRMSEHLILKLKINDDISQELSLYQTEISKYHQSQQMASEIVKVSDPLKHHNSLGYVFSFEKIYGQENFIIRIVQLLKYDDAAMSSFKWDPNSQMNFGSIQFVEETIYLANQNNKEYIRLETFEILNTEIRSLLFMHSFGYCQSLIDFGRLQAVDGVNIVEPLEKQSFGSMSLIFRDFGILRIKTLNKDTQQLQLDQGICEEEADEDEIYKFENHFALYAFYDDQNCLSKGEIYLYLKIHDLQIEIQSKVSISELLTIEDLQSLKKNRDSFCHKIFDQVVLLKLGNHLEATVDKTIQPMTEVIELIKRSKFQASIDEHDIIECELEVKSLGITLNQLAECSKTTQVSLIHRKLFKITSYFVYNLKNLKLQALTKRNFDWQIIYIDAYQRSQAKHQGIAITEKDIVEILAQIKNKQNGNLQQTVNENEILNPKVDRQQLLEFILDCIVFDENKQSLKISIGHLKSRIEDRRLLHQQFKLTGGRFLTKMGQIEDTDMAVFKTSLPQIEISKRLLLNIQKDFSDKAYDIKIYEIKVKRMQDEKKYQFEMFCVDQPHSIFRTDFLSQSHQSGKKIFMERFNVIQQMYQDYEENKFMKDGFVLAILEQSFPHSITFMILEPVSHIQWQYIISDDKLNPIENRYEKEYFVKLCKQQIESGIYSKVIGQQVKKIQNLGFQKDLALDEDQDIIEMWQGNLKSFFHEKSNIVYARNIEISEGIFAEISIHSKREFNAIKLQVCTNDIVRGSINFTLDVQRESSRILSGYFSVTDQVKLVYTIETACAYTQQEKAIRVIIREPKCDKKILDLLLCEKHLIDSKTDNVKDEVKLALNIGFKDSYALFQKLPELIPNFKKAFIKPEKRIKFEIEPDTSRIIYRKVVSYLDKTFVLYLKYNSLEMAEKVWLVVLYEQLTQYEEQFTFLTSQILTKEELQLINAKNERIMRDIVTKVVDKRLKIKLVEDRFNYTRGNEGERKKRYMVYFTEPQNGSIMESRQELHNFDIRNGYRFSLTNPESLIPETNQISQERLISQLEKDDLLFDVNEILNPYELILRIKTFEKESLKVVSVSDINEYEIRKELMKDKMSFLIEPQRRDELAKYLVQNINYDELKKKIFFLKSNVD